MLEVPPYGVVRVCETCWRAGGAPDLWSTWMHAEFDEDS